MKVVCRKVHLYSTVIFLEMFLLTKPFILSEIFDLKRTLKFFRNSENAEVLDNNRVSSPQKILVLPSLYLNNT